MALDVVPHFYEHLRNIGSNDRLDIFLYSQGGDTIVPWRLVTLARERCKHLGVLIPYKAHSAATMLALGADEIIMGEMGELSPIDPSIGTPFNPHPGDQPNSPPLEIGVEDVAGFFNFARDRLHIASEDNMIQALEMLITKLHPLALGSVYRSHALIRMIARNLLTLHMSEPTCEPVITQIVDNLAEKLYYHNYVINRKEGKRLGLKIVEPDEKLNDKMWQLYQSYKTEMGLGEMFNPGSFANQTEMNGNIAILDSRGLRSSYKKKILVVKTENAGKQEIILQEQLSPWVTEGIMSQEVKNE